MIGKGENDMKYVTKRNLMYVNMAAGVVGLIALLQQLTLKSSYNGSLSGISGQISFLYFLFVATIILELIALGIAATIYFYRKEQDRNLLVTLGVAAVVLLAMLLANSAVSILREAGQVLNGNLGSAFSLYSKYGNMSSADLTAKMENGLKILIFAYIVSTVYGGCNLFFYWKKKDGFFASDVKVDVDGQKVQETKEAKMQSAADTTEALKQNVNTMTDKIKAFYQTPNGKKTVLGIGAVIVLLLGYLVYVNVFKKTDINLINGCKSSVDGDSGNGYATVSGCQVAYNQNNDRLASFVHNIEYEVQGENGTFQNGDQVQVKAVYDEEEAKALKLRITDDTFSTEVKGLIEYYVSDEDVPKKIKNEVEKQMEEALALFIEDVELGDRYLSLDDDKDIVVTDRELKGKLFHVNDLFQSSRGSYIYIYQLTVEGQVRTSYFDDTYEARTRNVYVLFETASLSSDYLEEHQDLEESYDVFDSDDDSYADMKLEKIAKKIAYLSGRLSVIE